MKKKLTETEQWLLDLQAENAQLEQDMKMLPDPEWSSDEDHLDRVKRQKWDMLEDWSCI